MASVSLSVQNSTALRALNACKAKPQGIASAQQQIQIAAACVAREFGAHVQQIPATSSFSSPIVHVFLLDEPAQQENDRNLMLIWPRIVKALTVHGIVLKPNEMPQGCMKVKAWLNYHASAIGRITHLDFSNLDLTVIPREFLKLNLKNLELIDFDQNKLTEIPREFGKNTPRLRMASFCNNQLKAIPRELEENFWHLEMINLDGNKAIAQHRFLKMRSIFEYAMSLPKVKTLYQKANEHGRWRFSIEDFAEPFEGVCNTDNLRISINARCSFEEMVSTLIFELTNAVSAEEFRQVALEAEKGLLGREEYAKLIEQIEHRGTLLHHEIVSEAVSKCGWDPEIDTFKDGIKDFEAYWDWVKTSDHTENLRQRWDEIRRLYPNPQGAKN